METTNPKVGSITKTLSLILITGFVCAAILSCAYILFPFARSPRATSGQAGRTGEMERKPMIAADDDGAIHLGPQVAEPTKETHFITITTMEVIHDDVVTKEKATKARKLFMELQPNPNFQKALANPKARANIERLLNHPEIEKKLNGWFASLIRAAIHSKVNEPDFPELVAGDTYVDELFKQYGIA